MWWYGFENLRDLGQHCPLVLDRLDQEAGLLVPDPFLNARDDFALAQVGGSDAECVLGQRQQLLDALAAEGDVVLEAFGLLGEVGGEPVKQLLRLVDAVPAEVVEHPARDPQQQQVRGSGVPRREPLT